MKTKGFSLVFSFGSYGGFNYYSGYTKRLCLGWVAFYYFPEDIEDILQDVL